MVQFDVLGPLRVRVGGAELEIRRGIPRMILATLALRAGDVVSTDTLADVVWGDAQPQNPTNALQVQVSYLRRTLTKAGADARTIVTAGGGYRLDARPEQVDARRFEDLVRGALGTATEPDDVVDRLRALDEALGLWRGTPLDDLADAEFASGDRQRLEELRWEAVEARYDLLLALGRHREVIGELTQLAAEHPLRERFHEQRMLALYRSDRQADALRAYEQARTTLVEELGLDPGERLRELESRILARDPSLDVPGPPPAAPPGSGDSSAPAAPTGAAASPLPVPLTPTVGRAAELERLHPLLGRSRLLTLTGPAGAGKSRLAIELGLMEEATCRVVYIDLGPVPDPDLVAATVASRLGLSVLPDGEVVQQIADTLADEPTLLILDTCEHVVDAAAAVASGAAHRAASTRVLATSQRPLGVAGEVAWPVPPLAVAPTPDLEAVRRSPAVELFEQRAAAVRPDFAVDETNAADVAAICLSLDGLPLAIELAAAQVIALNPATIRDRLENRFAVLVHDSSDVPERQRTLRAAIDWSFAQLDASQRDLIGRLSVCPASFDLDTATTLAPPHTEEPMTVLASLVRHSVVMRDGEERFRLLDSIREYAFETLDDPQGSLRAHAEHFLHRAEVASPHVCGAEQLEWLPRVRQDIPHFRSAWLWADSVGDEDVMARFVLALSWFWTLEGLLDEAMQVYDRVLRLSAPSPAVRARLLAGYALLVASLGDLGAARTAAESAVDLLEGVDDPAALGDALNALAVAQWALGEHGPSADTHDRAHEAYRSAGDLWGVGVALTLRARTAIDAGEPAAEPLAADALDAARACGDRHIVALALDQLARVHLHRGDTSTAEGHALECLSLTEAIGYVEGVVAALHLLGAVALAAGRIQDADDHHRRQLAMAASIGHVAAICEAIDDLARVAVHRGELVDAGRWWGVVDRERERRCLPRRLPDDAEISRLRSDHGVEHDAGDGVPLDALVAELKP